MNRTIQPTAILQETLIRNTQAVPAAVQPAKTKKIILLVTIVITIQVNTITGTTTGIRGIAIPGTAQAFIALVSTAGTALTMAIMIRGIAPGMIHTGRKTDTPVHSAITMAHPGTTDGEVLTITGIVHTAAIMLTITTTAIHPMVLTGTGTTIEIRTPLLSSTTTMTEEAWPMENARREAVLL